jgi:hypothetical protein
VAQGFDWQNCRGLGGYTPLHYAASRGHAPVVSELLRASPGLVSLANDAGETALHLAAYSGNLQLMEQLLDRGAAIDATNKEGETSLAYAARKGMSATVRLLLQRGADESLQDQYGEAAFDYAEDAATQNAFDCRLLPLPLPLPLGSVREGESKEGSNTGGARAGAGQGQGQGQGLSVAQLTRILRYLRVADLCRAACVCSTWHAAAEHPSLWAALGVRRWEAALQGVLGGEAASQGSSRSGSRKSSKVGIAVLESRALQQEEELSSLSVSLGKTSV